MGRAAGIVATRQWRLQFRLRTLLLLPVLFALFVAWWRWPRTYHETSREDYAVEIPPGEYGCNHAMMEAARPTVVRWPIVNKLYRQSWLTLYHRRDDLYSAEVRLTYQATHDWRLQKQLHGHCRLSYQDAIVGEGNYFYDQPTGLWTFYDYSAGNWMVRGEFALGIMTGTWKEQLLDGPYTRECELLPPIDGTERRDFHRVTEYIAGQKYVCEPSPQGFHRRGYDASGKMISEQMYRESLDFAAGVAPGPIPISSVGLYSNGKSRYEERNADADPKDYAHLWSATTYDSDGIERRRFRLDKKYVDLGDGLRRPRYSHLLGKSWDHPINRFGTQTFDDVLDRRVIVTLPGARLREIAAIWSMQVGVPIFVSPAIEDDAWSHLQLDERLESPDWMPLDMAFATLESFGLVPVLRFGVLWITSKVDRDHWTDQTGVISSGPLCPEIKRDGEFTWENANRICYIEGGISIVEIAKLLEERGTYRVVLRNLTPDHYQRRGPCGLGACDLRTYLGVICELWQLKVSRESDTLVLEPR